MRVILLAISHLIAAAFGFGLGVYLLPILTAPPSLDRAILAETAKTALYSAEFKRDLKGSDFLHWGEGKVSVSPTKVVHEGELAPGPNYKLYLVKEFVEDEEQFLKVKGTSKQLGDIRTFDGFLVEVPDGVDIEAYNTVLVWCEAFNEFITAAKYK